MDKKEVELRKTVSESSGEIKAVLQQMSVMSTNLKGVAGNMDAFVKSRYIKSFLEDHHTELIDTYKTQLRKVSDALFKFKKRYDKAHERGRKAVIALDKLKA